MNTSGVKVIKGQKRKEGVPWESTEVQSWKAHSWVLPVIQKNISKPLASASISFSRAPSCSANEVKSDLPARFSGSLLSNGWHAEKLTACAVLKMRSYNA